MEKEVCSDRKRRQNCKHNLLPYIYYLDLIKFQNLKNTVILIYLDSLFPSNKTSLYSDLTN